jgi:hypothetical protein
MKSQTEVLCISSTLFKPLPILSDEETLAKLRRLLDEPRSTKFKTLELAHFLQARNETEDENESKVFILTAQLVSVECLSDSEDPRRTNVKVEEREPTLPIARAERVDPTKSLSHTDILYIEPQ